MQRREDYLYLLQRYISVWMWHSFYPDYGIYRMQVVKLMEEITKEANIRIKEVKTSKWFSQLKEPSLRLKSESDCVSQQSESE